MLKDAKALKENVELKRKAEQIQTDALITDYIEGYKQKQLLEKADKVSVDQLELQFAVLVLVRPHLSKLNES